MIIRRYTNRHDKTYTYEFELPPVIVQVDQAFVGAIDSETVPIIEETLAKEMFYTMLRQIEMAHKNGELPKVVHK